MELFTKKTKKGGFNTACDLFSKKRIFVADTIWIALSYATDWVQSSPIPCGEDYLEVSKVVAGVAMTS